MNQPPSAPKSRVILALSITVLFWASAFAVIKSAVQAYGPGELATLRFTIAATALGIAAAIKGVRVPRGRQIGWFFASGFTGFALYHPLLNYGEQQISAGTAALIINSAPVWTALLAALVLHEKITPRKALGISISFAGVAMLVVGKPGGISLQPAAPAVLGSAICAAFYVTIQKKYLSNFNALEFTFWSILASVIMMLPVFGIQTFNTLRTAPLQATLEIAYLGIFPAAIAYMAFAYATVRLPASRVMTIMYVTPPITMLMAFAYPNQREMPTLLSIFGGIMAIAGVAVVNTAKKDTPTSSPAIIEEA